MLMISVSSVAWFVQQESTAANIGGMWKFHATRLAPSPTGALHLGHARTFLITWLLARQAGAKIYMRMEDLDAGRAKPESVRQAYDDLHWLGLDWDAYQEGPTAERQEEVVQSQRLALYQAALEALWQRGRVYPCICSRADIAAAVAGSASAPHEAEAVYPGTCRGRFSAYAESGQTTVQVAAQILAATGKAACFRLRVSDDGPVAFTDLFAGPQCVNVGVDAGDFPVTRFYQPQFPNHLVTLPLLHPVPSLPPAYQLACVVDDHAMGIDLVIRGDDLLPSTPRQIVLYGVLGWQAPRFAHVPLVVGTDGKRLAKRHGESRIAQFRAAGVTPERIVGWAAWRSGQIGVPRELSARVLLEGFDVTRVPRERVVLTAEDLAWLR